MNRILTHLLLIPLAATAFCASAADVPESGTNAINGVVRFTNADAAILARLGLGGDDRMTSFTILANTDSLDAIGASKTFVAMDPLSQAYELTVAANDLPLTYNVFAVLSLDGTYEAYWTATLAAPPLTSNSPPATVDLDECVALVELRYRDSLGQEVPTTGGRALVTETATGIWRARYLTQPPGRTGNFLVVPTGVEIELAVEVDTGADIYADRMTHRETCIMTLACDDQPVITLTIPDAGTLGRIVGNANLVGEIELAAGGYQELIGRPVIKALGPSNNQRYSALAAELPAVDVSRPFALENLVPSSSESWRVQAEMQFGEGHRFEYFITPALGDVEVTAGATTDLGDTFVMNPAWLVGRITLTGPPEFAGQVSALRGLARASDYDTDLDGIPDGVGPYGIYSSYVIATGMDELAPGATRTTAGGQATASFAGAFNPATAAFEGDYAAVVGMLNDQPGIWKYDGLSLVFDHPGTNGGPFVNESLSVFEDTPWQGTLAPGERATNNVYYGLAEVCLRIRSPAPFFYPRVINSYGYYTNYGAIGNILNSYTALLGNASAPPDSPDAATNEAVITMYLPQGAYTLHPAFSLPDPDGGVSEVQLPSIDVSVTAGERLCIEDCLRIVFTRPMCTTNYGFIAYADASSCDGTLTNLGVRASPLSDPSIRLSYSEIWILIGSRTNLTRAIQFFPEFDGYPAEYYSNIVITAVARDNQGRVATRQIIAHYDLTAPLLNCPDITATSPDGASVPVDFNVTATDDRPEPLRGPDCIPPSGTVFLPGNYPVTCTGSDLCRNTNTCTFQVVVRGPNEDCPLRVERTQLDPPMLTLAWNCPGTLQSADTLDGPWTNLTGAVSPHTIPADDSQKFFRICVSGDCGAP